jgi:hypothetical protein
LKIAWHFQVAFVAYKITVGYGVHALILIENIMSNETDLANIFLQYFSAQSGIP